MKSVNGFGALVLTAPVALACSTGSVTTGTLGIAGNGAGGDSTIPAEGGGAGVPAGGKGGGQANPPDQSGGTETGGTEIGGTTSTGGTPNDPRCSGTGGPSMVMLPEGYCIDSTEVTRAQYQAWLDTHPSTDGQISDCTWNRTFVADARCMSSTYLGSPTVCQTACDNHPQVCVDWCDACVVSADVRRPFFSVTARDSGRPKSVPLVRRPPLDESSYAAIERASASR